MPSFKSSSQSNQNVFSDLKSSTKNFNQKLEQTCSLDEFRKVIIFAYFWVQIHKFWLFIRGVLKGKEGKTFPPRWEIFSIKIFPLNLSKDIMKKSNLFFCTFRPTIFDKCSFLDFSANNFGQIWLFCLFRKVKFGK